MNLNRKDEKDICRNTKKNIFWEQNGDIFSSPNVL